MKKLKFLAIIGILGFTKNMYAVGGVELLTNVSAGSVSNPAMQATISSESVFYNPAAISFLEGEHNLYFGGYYANIDYRAEVGNSYLETTTPQFIPSFSYIYKKDKISYYMGMGMSGQGGVLKFDNNTSLIEDLDSTIIYGGGSFGVSYLYKENLSLSLGGKITYSKTTMDGTIAGGKIENEKDSFGIAPEISTYYKVNSKISLSAKYLHKTKLDYGNLASLLSLGSSFELNENQRLNFGYNWILEENEYSDSYEYAISFEQRINPKFKITLGYCYSDRGKNKDAIVDFTELSSHQIGLGGTYKATENIDLTIGVGKIRYESESVPIFNTKLKSKREEIVISTGVTMRL
ncbi:transporter [Cetobacterium sp. 2A]|uniref:transporter n=1 Tax=Cetobacterium sp. 2A TaxID=2754723 RepID=UPI00163D1460|nr:transporter [Cetobacterium sp. 2A]MBC2855187.1 transporter [Cetobacterium sp. 2A]